MSRKIINPLTGYNIQIGGATYNKLVKNGFINQKGGGKELTNQTQLIEMLNIAARDGDLISIKNLIDQGVDFKRNSEYALKVAIDANHLNIVQYFVENGSDINNNTNQVSPLVIASDIGNLDIVQYLVEKGADINIDNGLALIVAIQNNHFDIVQYLVEHGIDITNARGDDDMSAFDVAEDYKYNHIINYLQKHL